MKLISFLSRTAAIATVAFALGVAFDQYAVPFYAAAASAFVMLIVIADYAPRRRRWEPSQSLTANSVTAKSAQRLQLAA